MSAFTPAELEYLRSQRLGRIATAVASGQPHVVPVSFRYNAEQDAIEIGGHGGSRSARSTATCSRTPAPRSWSTTGFRPAVEGARHRDPRRDRDRADGRIGAGAGL